MNIQWEKLNNQVISLYEKGRYKRAIVVAEKALVEAEQAWEPDSLAVAKSLNTLGLLYKTQGDTAQAESLYERALAINEKAFGPDHPEVAAIVNNLARLCETEGRYEQAETLYKRALTIREKTLGLDHPDVALSLNDLARLFESQGLYAQAEPLSKRALAIREKGFVTPPPHPVLESTGEPSDGDGLLGVVVGVVGVFMNGAISLIGTKSPETSHHGD
jgi:tetratricopeptide (TPR) repeat protein